MDNKNISYWIGRILGITLVGCLAICLAAIAIALTIKFLILIF